MAISSGQKPHRAWVSGVGATFPLESGSAEINAKRESSTFSGVVPLNYPGAEAAFASVADNEVQIIVQSQAGAQALMTGEIDNIKMRYKTGEISFSGRCKSSKLHAKKSAEKWVNRKPHEIVQDLAGRVGLGVDIDPATLNAGRLMQIDWTKLTDGISYATVIHKAAELMGARWWVDAKGTLHVKSTDGSDGVYTINFVNGSPKFADVFELEINRNVQAGKPIKVNVKSFHAGKKQAFTGTYEIGGAGSTVEYNYHLPNHLQSHVDQHAKTRAKDHARHELTLTADMVGDVTINPAMKLQLIGTSFAQTFDMDTVHHTFGMAGHRMSISAKSAKAGRS